MNGWERFKNIYLIRDQIIYQISFNPVDYKYFSDIASTFRFIDMPVSDSSSPHINSITPSSGPIGTTIEIKGSNLAGLEGDLDAVFENQGGEPVSITGLGPVPRADGVIRIKIPDKVCRVNNSYSGLPCNSYLNMTPGIYKVYAMPWGKKSNVVTFTITSDSTTCSNGATNYPHCNADLPNVQLSSITPTGTVLGSQITLAGKGFSGHDTLVRVRINNVNAVLWGGMPSSDTSITLTLPADGKVCVIYTGASGLPCSGYQQLVAGNSYQVFIDGQNGKSNQMTVNITTGNVPIQPTITN